MINVTQIKGAQAQFNLAGQTFQATTDGNLKDLGQLKVTVKQISPSLVLSITPDKAQNSSANTASQLLRQFLPNQLPVTQALQQISQPNNLQLLPPAIQAQVASLLDQLFKPGQRLTGQDLQKHIQNSGLFFESSLKKQQPNKNDIKGKLLNLQQQVQNLASQQAASSKLSAILGQAINKITTQQLQLFENPSLLSLQLPLFSEAMFKQIQIDVYQKEEQLQANLEVMLKFKLLEDKEMVSKLILNEQENTLSVFTWSNAPEITEKMQHFLPFLEQRLKNSYFNQVTLQITPLPPQKSQQNKQIALIDLLV